MPRMPGKALAALALVLQSLGAAMALYLDLRHHCGDAGKASGTHWLRVRDTSGHHKEARMWSDARHGRCFRRCEWKVGFCRDFHETGRHH